MASIPFSSNAVFTHLKISQRKSDHLSCSSPTHQLIPSSVKKYGLTMMTSVDDQVKAYIKKIMSQLNKWMSKSKISKLVIVITSKETGEHVERWQFDVNIFGGAGASKAATISTSQNENASSAAADATQDKTDAEIQLEIQSLFRQITASVTFLPMLDGNCTFNVLVYADADSEVPLEWGDSDAKEVKNAEKVMLRSFSTNSHRIDTVVSYSLCGYMVIWNTESPSDATNSISRRKVYETMSIEEYQVMV
nr:mitotic spindle checkpoint component mad2 [Quercus suber]